MHCISVYITKDDGTFTEVPHLKLPQGFVLFTEKPKGLKKGRTTAYCETDYFGGAGTQRAKYWDDEVKVTGFSINEVLKFIGVKCDERMDEFDTIGLGNFRTNDEVDDLIYKQL